MKVAPKPAADEDRLNALWRYEILDTESDRMFDDLVELAAHICDVPISLVSLVDKDRQWSTARCGLDSRETSRDYAFCSHAILQSEVMVVEDTLEDDRFCDNPLVVGDPGIRFYAGSPLVTDDGFALGTICVIDQVPRVLSKSKIQALSSLSRQVVANLELRIQAKKMKELNEEKNQLFSVLAHDLRSPLASIASMANALLKNGNLFSEDEKNGWLNSIEAAASTTLGVTDNILRRVKFEEGYCAVEIEQLKVKDIVNDVVKQVFGKVYQKNLTLAFQQDREFFVKGDSRMFYSVLLNLLSNAMKYTESGGSIVVNASEREESGVITITDTGRGISSSALREIFSGNGYTTKGSTGELGTGLGIALCRDYMSQQGGELMISSEIGRGTKVTLVLPLSRTVEIPVLV